MNKETNVLPYYVVVAEIYESLQNFLQFCLHHNTKFIHIKNLNEYFRYLKKLQKLERKKHKMKTGRMTICQLKLF